MTEPWRDTASANWAMSWGEGTERTWLEHELGLGRHDYRLNSLHDRLDFRDPQYGDLKDLFLYDLVERRSSVPRKVVIGEISNGIYAVGYWRGEAT